jgi:hypothetical protein
MRFYRVVSSDGIEVGRLCIDEDQKGYFHSEMHVLPCVVVEKKPGEKWNSTGGWFKCHDQSS